MIGSLRRDRTDQISSSNHGSAQSAKADCDDDIGNSGFQCSRVCRLEEGRPRKSLAPHETHQCGLAARFPTWDCDGDRNGGTAVKSCPQWDAQDSVP